MEDLNKPLKIINIGEAKSFTNLVRRGTPTHIEITKKINLIQILMKPVISVIRIATMTDFSLY